MLSHQEEEFVMGTRRRSGEDMLDLKASWFAELVVIQTVPVQLENILYLQPKMHKHSYEITTLSTTL